MRLPFYHYLKLCTLKNDLFVSRDNFVSSQMPRLVLPPSLAPYGPVALNGFVFATAGLAFVYLSNDYSRGVNSSVGVQVKALQESTGVQVKALQESTAAQIAATEKAANAQIATVEKAANAQIATVEKHVQSVEKQTSELQKQTSELQAFVKAKGGGRGWFSGS